MKNYQLIVFLVIVITIYSLANIYIYLRGYNSIAVFQSFRILYFTIFVILASTFIFGKFLEARHSSVLSDILNIVGGFWMAFMLYGVLFLFVSDRTSILRRPDGNGAAPAPGR